jgi:hypothetical protein
MHDHAPLQILRDRAALFTCAIEGESQARRRVLVALCPPLALPERPRRLPATRGFFFNPSLEGGLELFELSCPICRRRSATSACSAAIWRFSEAINSSTSAGRRIPPLIQILSPKSPTFLPSKANSTKL